MGQQIFLNCMNMAQGAGEMADKDVARSIHTADMPLKYRGQYAMLTRLNRGRSLSATDPEVTEGGGYGDMCAARQNGAHVLRG